jgi:hypothetical protein
MENGKWKTNHGSRGAKNAPLRFLLNRGFCDQPSKAAVAQAHLQESTELIAMLTASIKTAKSNPNRGNMEA